jgi:hypothetical protein
MSNEPSRFIDPKTQLLQWIVEQDKLMTGYMLNHDETKAAHVIALLLLQIDPDADSSLSADIKQLKTELTLSNYDSLNEEDINTAYGFIHTFLIKTYYKGWGSAAPKEKRPEGKL